MHCLGIRSGGGAHVDGNVVVDRLLHVGPSDLDGLLQLHWPVVNVGVVGILYGDVFDGRLPSAVFHAVALLMGSIHIDPLVVFLTSPLVVKPDFGVGGSQPGHGFSALIDCSHVVVGTGRDEVFPGLEVGLVLGGVETGIEGVGVDTAAKVGVGIGLLGGVDEHAGEDAPLGVLGLVGVADATGGVLVAVSHSNY